MSALILTVRCVSHFLGFRNNVIASLPDALQAISRLPALTALWLRGSPSIDEQWSKDPGVLIEILVKNAGVSSWMKNESRFAFSLSFFMPCLSFFLFSLIIGGSQPKSELNVRKRKLATRPKKRQRKKRKRNYSRSRRRRKKKE